MIKINLGLDGSPFTSKEDILVLFSAYFNVCDEHSDFRVDNALYVNPRTKEEVSERTAVFSVCPKPYYEEEDIDYAIKKLCSIFKQDSIAYNSKILKLYKVIHNIRYKGERYKFNEDYFIF